MKHLKLMLIEDEMHIRTLIKESIDWNAIGVDIIAEASNAYEALEVLDECEPDVIMSDVCMPFMDGIELSNRILRKFPTIKIVILSGHDEFEFAQRAIKVGVSDFLLKPIKKEEIVELFEKLRKQIIIEEENRKQTDQIKEIYNKYSDYIFEKAIDNILKGVTEQKFGEQIFKYYDLPTNLSKYEIVLIKADERDKELKVLYTLQAYEVMKEYFCNEKNVKFYNDGSNMIVLISFRDGQSLSYDMEEVIPLIVRRCNWNFTIGISNMVDHIEDLSLAYKQAEKSLDYVTLIGWNRVIIYREIGKENNIHKEIRLTDSLLKNMYIAIQAGNVSDVLDAIDEIFSENINVVADRTQLKLLGINLAAKMLNSMNEQLPLSNQENVSLQKIFEADTLPEMRSIFKIIAKDEMERISLEIARKRKGVLEDVRKYIEENYADEELSLLSVAAKFYVNPSYLSRIFKDFYGVSFIEYATKLKMEKAICLLRETDAKGYEIAEKIGIKDPKYFSFCFKKYTGQTINEFRKRLCS